VLSDPFHAGAIYELVGTSGLSQTQVAEVASRRLQRNIEVQSIPLTQWEAQAQAGGMQAYELSTLMKMFTYYEDYGMWGSVQSLTSLLGRQPNTLESFIHREIIPEQSIEVDHV
jgi:hypothetical protein